MNVPSSPADRQKLRIALEEITNCMAMQDAQKDQMKEIITTIKENFELDPKHIRKMAKTMYDRSYADLQKENEEFEVLYETVIEGANPDGTTADDED